MELCLKNKAFINIDEFVVGTIWRYHVEISQLGGAVLAMWASVIDYQPG